MYVCSCGAPRAKHQPRCESCRRTRLQEIPLTAKQSTVFSAFLSGESQKQTAFRLGSSEKTIATHKLCVMRKVGARNDIELVLAGVRLGLIAA